MFKRSVFGAFALLAVTACCTHRSATSTGVTALHATGPVRVTEKILKDNDENTVTLRLDGSEAAKIDPITVTDKHGNRLKVYHYELNDVTVCLPPSRQGPQTAAADTAKAVCQPVSSMTEGAFFKVGSASCICWPVWKGLKCYGNTCP